MISTLLTIAIFWNTNKLPYFCGANTMGCYVQGLEGQKEIFMSENNKVYADQDTEKDFMVYDELGEAIYGNIYPPTLFHAGTMGEPADQMVADDFAFWIYAQKYPADYKDFATQILDAKQVSYFEATCEAGCVMQLLNLKTD